MDRNKKWEHCSIPECINLNECLRCGDTNGEKYDGTTRYGPVFSAGIYAGFRFQNDFLNAELHIILKLRKLKIGENSIFFSIFTDLEHSVFYCYQFGVYVSKRYLFNWYN